MEQKTNPSGEQAATQAPQPTAWIERVRALADDQEQTQEEADGE